MRTGRNPPVRTVDRGLAADATLAVLATPDPSVARWGLVALGILTNAVATAAYIGAGLGPGPRDGLMMGWVARTGANVRRTRTTIELVVLAAGWLLGGTVGVATVLYALSIGPLVHALLPRLAIHPAPPRPALAPA